MNAKNIIFFLMLLTALPGSAELSLGASAGSNKWGYAGNHNAIVTTVKAGGKYEITAEITFPLPGPNNPMPFDSWLGIYTEDPVAKNRVLVGLLNSEKTREPHKLTNIVIGYENGGEMQKSIAGPAMELKPTNHLWLRMTIANGTITLERSFDGNIFQPMITRKTIAGYAPSIIGVMADNYSSAAAMTVTYNTLKIKTKQEDLSFDFSEKNRWKILSSAGIANFISPATSPVAIAAINHDQTFYNVTGSKVDTSGIADISKALQQLFDDGHRRLFFPSGTYAISNLKIPGNSYLKFADGATLKMVAQDALKLNGDHITIDGATFDFNIMTGNLITGKNLANLNFLNLKTNTWKGTITGKEKLDTDRHYPILINLESCQDIELEGGYFADLRTVLYTKWCRRVVVKNNKAERCNMLVFFGNGSEFLQHYGNWSRNVKYQCMWWGGDCNDTHNWITKNSARVVKRNFIPGQVDNDKDTAGAYDILVQNNFAEYGTTLAWGSKGRNVIISGNIARYMGDLAYDTEGGENVVISGNISINSKCAGIGCYFYGERLLISGNQILTLNEGENEYKGGFIRLHSPGDSRHFGNGEVTISGNQFINETDKMKNCGVEASRRVFFKGNTFKNGSINILPSADNVVVSECTFDNNLSENNTAITASGGDKERIFTNNIFRRNGKNVPSDDPAILLNSAGNSQITIQGNIMAGWSRPLSCRNSGAVSQLRMTGNSFGAAPSITGQWQVTDKYNINE